ncbi:unnamed protein product, partial [Closterium sp. NIES-65]
ELGHCNQLPRSLPDTLGRLSSPMGLSTASHGNLKDSVPQELGNLQQLTRLYLFGNDLLDSLPEQLSQLQKLQSLHVSNHDYLSGELPAWIFSLTDLTSLAIQRNNFSGSIPEAISSLKQLRKLVLEEKELSGSIPEAIGALTNLHNLKLQSNSSLSGSIPEAISSLKQLRDLSLFDNGLSGSIPDAISSLQLLQELDLHCNRLSGTIPACITHLTALTSLMLNANHLAGTIPAAITTLTNLEILHLENNQLTGELPSFHHIARLTSQYGLSADHNYLTSTADPFPFNGTSLDSPSESHSWCLFYHNCLENDAISCASWQNQRYGSECRAFCGAQPLTPPCSGHGVCSFVRDYSYDMSACEAEHELPPPYCAREPEGQCDCDEGYTPGTAAGTCVPHGIAAVGVTLSALQAPQNLLLLMLLPLAVLLLLAFKLPQLLRRLKNRPPTRYFFSKRALAARQAAMGVEINC